MMKTLTSRVSKPAIGAGPALGCLSARLPSQQLAFADGLRRRFERAFQTDLKDVKVQVSLAPLQHHARATACGSVLDFLPGAFNPSTPAGLQLLAHELAHVVQQRQGRATLRSTAAGALLHDPALELEADAASEDFMAGRAISSALRGARTSASAPSVCLQAQKFGWLGQELITVGAEDPERGSDDQAVALKDKPEAADPVMFNSTTTLNEIYATRDQAWQRAMELASALSGRMLLVPLCIYRIAEAATAKIQPGEIASFFRDAKGAAPGNSTQRVWARFTVSPDAATRGFYYDYYGPYSGGNLLVVEHTEDVQAIVSFNTNRNGKGGWTQTAGVGHFHVAMYKPSPAFACYLDINKDGFKAESYEGGPSIMETSPMVGRSGYVMHRLPDHHIYYR